MHRYCFLMSWVSFGCSNPIEIGPGYPTGIQDEVTDNPIALIWGDVEYDHNSVLEFDSGQAGVASQSLELTFVNQGDVPIMFSSDPLVVFWGEGSSLFSLSSPPSPLLEPNEETTFNIDFETAEDNEGALSAGLAVAWGVESTERFWVKMTTVVQPIEYVDVPLIVAAGSGGALAVSYDDGVTWWESQGSASGEESPTFFVEDVSSITEVESPFTRPDVATFEWNDVVHTGDRFVVFGTEGTDRNADPTRAWSSRDGFHWTTLDTTAIGKWDPEDGVVLNSGVELFADAFSVYDLLPETDVFNSLIKPSERPVTGLATDGVGAVLVTRTGWKYWSLDGSNWTHSEQEQNEAALEDVAFGNGLYVAVGRGQRSMVSSDGGRTWTETRSHNGSTPHPHNCDPYIDWCDVDFLNGVFVMYDRSGEGGSTVVWTSRDGMDWVSDSVDTGFKSWGLSHHSGATVATGSYPYKTLVRGDDGRQFETVLDRPSDFPGLHTIATGSVRLRKDEVAKIYPGY